jgi:hypothetical protein
MVEFKLIVSSVLSKPRLAMVLWCIRAEPDARPGVWCGSKGLDDMFVIAPSQIEAMNWVIALNNPKQPVNFHVDRAIMDYLKRKDAVYKSN